MINQRRSANAESRLKLSHASWLALVSAGYLAVIFWRSWSALGRLPADPGYGHMEDALRNPLSIVFSTRETYLQILPRLIAEFVILFPIEYHAVVTASLVNLMWVACALVIAQVIYSETGDRLLSGLSGSILLLVPAAMESALGNIGNVKWAVTAAVATAYCSASALQRFRRSIITGTIILGLTQPLLVVVCAPLIWQLTRTQSVTRRTAILGLAAIFATFAAQIVVAGLDSASRGWGSARVLAPWPNMGLFWWFGLLSPALGAIVVTVVGTAPALRQSQRRQLWNLLAVNSVLLSVASYLLGGITDRYFVVPMTLTWVAAALLLQEFWVRFGSVGRFIAIAVILTLLVPTAKWFKAGWYLTSGESWHSQVVAARMECESTDVRSVRIGVTPVGSHETACELLKD